jgi:hypothetical protein
MFLEPLFHATKTALPIILCGVFMVASIILFYEIAITYH